MFEPKIGSLDFKLACGHFKPLFGFRGPQNEYSRQKLNTDFHLTTMQYFIYTPSSKGEKVKRKTIGKGVLFIKGHFNLFP